MDKAAAKRLIDVAAGREAADLVIKNGTLADVYNGCFIKTDVAICDGLVAGLGDYGGEGPEPRESVDARGLFVLPGFIESHIHIESAMVGPAEFGRLLVPHGTTTAVADPHEIVNVAGLPGLNAMVQAAGETALDIKFMIPPCVPAASFERGGAALDAGDLAAPLRGAGVPGLAEFMDYPAVIAAEDGAVEKLLLAYNAGKIVDGHSPGVNGKDLNAYAAFIRTDHEVSDAAAMRGRIRAGMYVMLRHGSACHDLRALIPGITAENSRRCVLCSDDRQSETLIEQGDMDDLLRICVEEGLEPMTALRMATINAAECFRLFDRGAIAPGLRADLALVDNLKNFAVRRVFCRGVPAATDGHYLLPVPKLDAAALRKTFHVKDFSEKKLALPLKSDQVLVIDIRPGTVLTGKGIARIKREGGCFVYDPRADIVKIAVIERHHGTGLVGLGLLRGYGIRQGAIAVSIAHDSHNIITTGTNDADMCRAVERLIALEGGAVLARDGAILAELPLPLGGLMSDESGEWVTSRLKALHRAAWEELGINRDLEPVLGFAFMSLAVIPELKITCEGLFDVGAFGFVPVDAPVTAI